MASGLMMVVPWAVAVASSDSSAPGSSSGQAHRVEGKVPSVRGRNMPKESSGLQVVAGIFNWLFSTMEMSG
jgi:hypothetical protein